MKVLQFPLTRISFSFIAGIVFANFFVLDIKLVFSILFITFFGLAISYLLANKNMKSSVCFGLITCILSFIIGVSNQIIHTESFRKDNYIHSKSTFEKPHLVSVTIREKLRSSSFADRFVCVVDKIDGKFCSGRILLNVKKEVTNRHLIPGTQIQINGYLVENKPPLNPNQFDYGQYLNRKQIYSQMYASSLNMRIGSFIEKNIWFYTSKLRTKIIRNLEKNHYNSAELHVAIALILGQQQEISPDIIRDYQFAGAVHILSVSGLHIGFIMLFITFLLKPFPNSRRGSFIKLIIILISLFSFAVIAGLSPSVVRSVTMFSFVAVGMFLRRSTYIFHTLLVSALLILLFKPSFLFEVGFQLSYTALFFILWLQPLLAKLWLPNNKIVKYFWEILTVSFAAQIGVLPLSIYYFHQFPGLFFITNLVIIPFLSVIMALGILVMILAALNCLPIFLSSIVEWSIFMLNKIINFIASFEQFIFRDIAFNWQLMCSLYFLVFATIIWFKKPNYPKLVLTLVAVALFQITYFGTQINVHNQSELTVFNSKKNSFITERNGKEVTLFSDNNFLKSASENKTLSAYLMGNFSHLESKNQLKNLLYFRGKKILILDSLGVYQANSKPDIIIITQSPRINFERLLKTEKPEVVVADASNYKSYLELWRATCKNEKIPFHATSEKGFYRVN